MSFYLATAFDDRIELLTDRAGYSSDAVLRTLDTKIHPVEGHPVAISARGHVGWSKRFVAAVKEMIAKAGFDIAMIGFGRELPQYAGRLAANEAVELCISGISPTKGPVIYFFRTEEEAGFVEPYKLYESAGTVICGIDNAGHHERIREAGTLRDRGVAFVEMFRADPSISTLGINVPAHVVGGGVNFTVIDASGVRTESLHTWTEDEIGRRIEPRRADSVQPLPAMKMNRHERRAAKKQGRVAA